MSTLWCSHTFSYNRNNRSQDITFPIPPFEIGRGRIFYKWERWLKRYENRLLHIPYLNQRNIVQGFILIRCKHWQIYKNYICYSIFFPQSNEKKCSIGSRNMSTGILWYMPRLFKIFRVAPLDWFSRTLDYEPNWATLRLLIETMLK